MVYVISRKSGYVAHEGDRPSCERYVATCVAEWDHDPRDYVIAEGAASRNLALKAVAGK